MVNTSTSAETLLADETTTTACSSGPSAPRPWRSYVILIESATIDTLEDESDATFSIVAPLPVINSVTRDIYVPTSMQSVTVTANVTGGATPYTINLKYTINFGSEQTVAVTDAGSDNYTGVIPPQLGGKAITSGGVTSPPGRCDQQHLQLPLGITPWQKPGIRPRHRVLTYMNYPCRVVALP
jgi:hypothetical protein